MHVQERMCKHLDYEKSTGIVNGWRRYGANCHDSKRHSSLLSLAGCLCSHTGLRLLVLTTRTNKWHTVTQQTFSTTATIHPIMSALSRSRII